MVRHRRDLWRAVGAVVLCAALLAGVPALLWWAAGWPLPTDVPSWGQVSSALTSSLEPGVVIDLLALVCWVAWGVLAWAVLVELAATVRGRTARRRRLVGPVQALAAWLVASITLFAAHPVGAADGSGLTARPRRSRW
jgi:hypothetical protein